MHLKGWALDTSVRVGSHMDVPSTASHTRGRLVAQASGTLASTAAAGESVEAQAGAR